MTGKRFGKWTVIERAEPLKDKNGNNITRWKCKCDCGEIRDITGTTLRSGKSKSCGCDNLNRINAARLNFTTHGKSKTRLYKIWAYMRKRCNNPKASNYYNYGGRGISVCDEWNKFESFKSWAESNGYSDALSLDRIDVNGNYCPSNCRWADRVLQANNRRNTIYYDYDGITKSIADWAREYGLNYKSLYKKLKSGIELSQIITNTN